MRNRPWRSTTVRCGMCSVLSRNLMTVLMTPTLPAGWWPCTALCRAKSWWGKSGHWARLALRLANLSRLCARRWWIGSTDSSRALKPLAHWPHRRWCSIFASSVKLLARLNSCVARSVRDTRRPITAKVRCAGLRCRPSGWNVYATWRRG